ncbi:MAG: transposase [Bacteroidetes bacterium]|nr:transposase [Bacteroidota bacterium]
MSNYKFHDSRLPYFVTFTVVRWVDIFTRKDYRDIIVESLNYCITHKGLKVHAWCLMSNHLHMIMSAENNTPGAIIRDFKKYTAKRIIKHLTTHREESRRTWLLWIFNNAGKGNPDNTYYQLWQNGSHPIVLYSPHVTAQKMNYIHQNPVKAGIVSSAEHYLYSSALDYSGIPGLIPLEVVAA